MCTAALGRGRALHAASLGSLTCICILQSAWHRLPSPNPIAQLLLRCRGGWAGHMHAVLCCAAHCAGAASWPFITGTVCPPGLLNLLPPHLSLTHTRNKYVRARVRYYSIGVTPSRIIHAHACGYTTPRFQISMEADRRIEGCWRRPIAATDKTSWLRALISFFPFFVFLF